MTRNFGVIFTLYVTNSREYNNRIPHVRTVGVLDVYLCLGCSGVGSG